MIKDEKFMFNKSKNLEPIPKIETAAMPHETESILDRNSILADWNISSDGFSDKSFSQTQSGLTGSIKKGYKLCTKCLSAVPATEQKCPSCGFIKK